MTVESHYARELLQFGETYGRALREPIGVLANAVASSSRSSIIGVGSGGSFTIASIICTLHEKFAGRVSRPSTPLEIACNPSLASRSPAFFVSAEGKNPDIVEALGRARAHSARAINVITNKSESPLIELARTLDIKPLVFEQPEKDGYLATNSLLANAVLVARAYASLSLSSDGLPKELEQLTLGSKTVSDWLQEATSFAAVAAKRHGIIVIYSPALKPIAVDLESRLSESALLYCQLADLRSFAHGRHLWATQRPDECTILAVVEKELEGLCAHTLDLLPDVQRHVMVTADNSPASLIAGLVAEMKLVSLLAQCAKCDPARPPASSVGRALYYSDLPLLLGNAGVTHDNGIAAKQSVYGAGWPHDKKRSLFERALASFKADLYGREFRAIVFDFDGTLSPSRRRDVTPAPVCSQLTRLLDHGITVAIVSGRGDSMREQLRSGLGEEYWAKVTLGLYSGGWVTDLRAEQPSASENSEFLSHVTRIARQLEAVGMPIEKVAPEQPYQVSIRFHDGVDTDSMWFVLADAMRQAGLDPGGLVRSRHSIDILAPGTSKTYVISWLLQMNKMLPHDILAVGDQGAWPGNDSALLDHRYSLSVDIPSRRMDRGWKLAPSNKEGVDATLWYLERVRTVDSGRFVLDLDRLDAAPAQ